MRYEDEELAHTLTVGGTVEDIGMLNDDDACARTIHELMIRSRGIIECMLPRHCCITISQFTVDESTKL